MIDASGDPSAPSPGTNPVTVAVVGNLSLGGTNNLSAGPGFTNGTYTLLTYTGTLGGNLPVLGPLFRSTQFQRGESELVILVTPYLVRPSSGPLSAPTDGYTPPTDADLYLNRSDTHATQAPAVAAPLGAAGSGLIGPAGFILN